MIQMAKIFLRHFSASLTERAFESSTAVKIFHKRRHIGFTSVTTDRSEIAQINDIQWSFVWMQIRQRRHADAKRKRSFVQLVRSLRRCISRATHESWTAVAQIFAPKLCGAQRRLIRLWESRWKLSGLGFSIVFNNLDLKFYALIPIAIISGQLD